METSVYTALCDFIPFLYAGALCGCFMPWLIPLYTIWPAANTPGSSRVTEKQKFTVFLQIQGYAPGVAPLNVSRRIGSGAYPYL